MKKVLLIILILILLGVGGYFLYPKLFQETVYYDLYVKSNTNEVSLLDSEYKEVEKIIRGTKIKTDNIIKDDKYIEIIYKDKTYNILKENLCEKIEDVVDIKKLYVRTNATIYTEEDSTKITGMAKKGTELEIIGYYKLDSKGNVEKYKIKMNDTTGYVYSKYLVETKEEAIKVYSENGIQEYMAKMGDTLGGGNATKLDYYPYEKAKFENNKMPEEVRSLYLNGGVISNIDNYISFAKENNINAFVIDIKDNGSVAYASSVMKEYSKTTAEHAINDYETYKNAVKKAKDAGIYVIGRITTFNDTYLVSDHPEVAIQDKNGKPLYHNSTYWPSAYNRYVWEYTVTLAKEAVEEVGFNEIQFDYVRFPDRTYSYESTNSINFNNKYNESKAEAIQGFVMYACDEIHKVGAYVSIDVFGESVANYVTAYGQFFPAISNVADVISAMPYPDHFNAHDYGISEVVWTVPYKLLDAWGSQAAKKQEVIPTPAIARTWIQAYDAIHEPHVVYDSTKVSEEISALYKNGLTGGYMTWNSGSNLDKYKYISAAFKKEY